MILENETFTKFGYYPSMLAPMSKKGILAKCDDCGEIREVSKHGCHALCRSCAQKGVRNPNFGKHFSEDHRRKIGDAQRGEKGSNYGKPIPEATKRKIREAKIGKPRPDEVKKKISEALTGVKHPYFGKHRSEAVKKKISDANKGEKGYWYGKHLSEETKQKKREARKRQRMPTHHTKPELVFEDICKQNNINFHYVGDGQLWIGKKGGRQLNPDFIEANGKKICVEIFGDYWHSPLINRNMNEYGTLEYRRQHYRRYKWQSIFLWETDLKREDVEAFVLSTLRKEGVV